MASMPYPLNRLYTHIVSVIATTQSACILMSVWVWQGCHTLLQIPLLLFLNNLFSCSSVFSTTTCSPVLLSFQKQPVLLFFCLFNNNLFSCSLVFSKTTCSPVLLSFQKQHVLMFFCLFKQHVLLFSCLSKKHVLLSFPQKNHILHPILSLCRQKKNG